MKEKVKAFCKKIYNGNTSKTYKICIIGCVLVFSVTLYYSIKAIFKHPDLFLAGILLIFLIAVLWQDWKEFNKPNEHYREN